MGEHGEMHHQAAWHYAIAGLRGLVQDASRLHLPTIALNPRLTLWGMRIAAVCCRVTCTSELKAGKGPSPF